MACLSLTFKIYWRVLCLLTAQNSDTLYGNYKHLLTDERISLRITFLPSVLIGRLLEPRRWGRQLSCPLLRFRWNPVALTRRPDWEKNPGHYSSLVDSLKVKWQGSVGDDTCWASAEVGLSSSTLSTNLYISSLASIPFKCSSNWKNVLPPFRQWLKLEFQFSLNDWHV